MSFKKLVESLIRGHNIVFWIVFMLVMNDYLQSTGNVTKILNEIFPRLALKFFESFFDFY